MKNTTKTQRTQTQKQQNTMQQQLACIATRELRIETLETRNSDSLDFHELGVSSLKSALEAAYQAGLAAAQRNNA